MGLDQFLLRRKKMDKKGDEYFNNLEYEEWKESKVAQWRKANQIHKYFVDVVQDGVDDCGYYLCSKEDIEELVDKCKMILDECKLVDGEVVNGFIFENGERKPQLENGKVIDKQKYCASILPTQGGFFFGSLDYDEYYYSDIEYTYNELKKVLDEINFDEEELYYTSSW